MENSAARTAGASSRPNAARVAAAAERPAVPRSLTPVLFGSILFLATAAFVLWQNAHVAMLWDLSYLLDSSDRIALGQIPYRDFPFAHAPLTFLLQAASIHLFGRVYWHVVAYAALSGASASLLTWRILARLLQTRAHGTAIAFLLTLPLIALGTASIFPHPIYDNDCILAILFALYCLQRIAATTPLRNLLTGAALVPPLFFKQNIGLIFLAATLITLLAAYRHSKTEPASGIWKTASSISNASPALPQCLQPEMSVLLGALITLAAALFTIQYTAGLGNYLHWTIAFAAQQRLPSLSSMLGVYNQPQLLWSLPAAIAALSLLHLAATRENLSSRPEHRAFAMRSGKTRSWKRFNPRDARRIALTLLAAPFLYTLASLLWFDDPSDRADQLLTLWPHLLILAIASLLYDIFRRRFTSPSLLPLLLLAAIQGTFLSQQLWGSNYAIWPLLMLLIACLLPRIPNLALPLAATVAAVFCINGSLYALSHERLSYSQLTGALARSTLPALRGLTTPGPWLPAFDELVQDTNQNIPQDDAILLFPGQDPFYYATGRTPRFPVLLFDVATSPYTPQQLAEAAAQRDVRWLIVNRNLQLSQPPLANYNEYLQALSPLFKLDHQLTNYDIYHRR